MIPKIIHCCWFGKNPIPDDLQAYMNTWALFCPDYEIKVWNEDIFDVNTHPFTASAYQQKKYAYVSDYVRAYALYHFGGIYLDTDVELKKNLDMFLSHEAFSGFEKVGLPFTAVWGAIPQHSLTHKVLEYYSNRKYDASQETNTLSVSRLIIEDFKINPNKNELQHGEDEHNTLTIYPAEYLCLDLMPNFATHHFAGSWLPEDTTVSYKDYLHADYYIQKSIQACTKKDISNLKAIASNLTLSQIMKILIFKIYYLMKNIKR